MRELLLPEMAYGRYPGYVVYMEKAGGENERASQKCSSKMEPYELQRYTGMKPQALAVWNTR